MPNAPAGNDIILNEILCGAEPILSIRLGQPTYMQVNCIAYNSFHIYSKMNRQVLHLNVIVWLEVMFNKRWSNENCVTLVSFGKIEV